MKRRSKLIRRLLSAVSILLLLFGLDYWLYPRFAHPATAIANLGRNGIWLRYTWYFGERSRTDVVDLADRLRRYGISDAFFHVRSVDGQGRLSYRCAEAAEILNTELRTLNPSIRRIAWVYIGNLKGGGSVDLGSPQVRRNLVSQAQWLVATAGFDGVQWDYEVCPDGDRRLISLLDETRAALPRAYVGVASPGWYPGLLGSEGWSAGYFREVARRCDGIAVMAYDSGMVTPRAYVWWVGAQVVQVTTAVAGTGCRVLIGVPTYRSGTLSHNAYAENLRLALIGVRDGLANRPNLSAWQGVSVFADYTTTDMDWREFDRLWPTGPKHE